MLFLRNKPYQVISPGYKFVAQLLRYQINRKRSYLLMNIPAITSRQETRIIGWEKCSAIYRPLAIDTKFWNGGF